MQRREQVGCGLITLRDGCGWVAFDKTLDAEILGDQESGVEVGVMDGWRREAARAQGVVDRDPGFDILRQMHRRAV